MGETKKRRNGGRNLVRKNEGNGRKRDRRRG